MILFGLNIYINVQQNSTEHNRVEWNRVEWNRTDQYDVLDVLELTHIVRLHPTQFILDFCDMIL